MSGKSRSKSKADKNQNSNQTENQQHPQSAADKAVLCALWNIFKEQDEYIDNEESKVLTIDKNLQNLSAVINNKLSEIDSRLRDEIPSVLYEIKEFYDVADVANAKSIAQTIREILQKL